MGEMRSWERARRRPGPLFRVVPIGSSETSLPILFQRALSMSHDAATPHITDRNEGDYDFDELWRAYFTRLVRFASARLNGFPRRDADEEDVALSAMKSFHRGVVDGRIPQISDPDDLWRILLKITSRKASKRIRYATAQRRGGGKVRGESLFLGRLPCSGMDQILPARPTPRDLNEVLERCAEMLDMLGEESLVRVATMKLEGYTNEEIARELQCVVRTVERKLFRIRLKWESLLEANRE